MPVEDLREWIKSIEEMGELTRVEGADPHLELGGLVDLFQWDMENPALLFENVEGYDVPVFINMFGTHQRMAMALGVVALSLVWWVALE